MNESPLVMLAIDLEDTTRQEVSRACRGRWLGAELISISSTCMPSTMFRSIRPDIIILDLDTAFTNRSSIVQTIRDFCSAPLIALSYASDVTKTVKTLQDGADCFMLKPVHQRELVAHIDSLLKNSCKHLKEIKGEIPKGTLDTASHD